MEYNQSQKRAIDSGRCRLLVSAGAGSGKTRVLVGRVLRLVAEERRSLGELLIITFTRAAAAELRSRILSGLSALAAERPSDAHIRRQLASGLDSVTTIDAFYSRIVREYAHVLGVGEYRVIEGAERDLLKRQAVSEAVEQVFASEDEDIRALVSSLPLGAAQRVIADGISRLYEAEQNQPFPKTWRRETLERYSQAQESQLGALRGLFLACDMFSDVFGSHKLRTKALDFGDMSRLMVRLLCRIDESGAVRPTEAADVIGARYAEVFIDEFQDTNRIQTLVAEMLTHKTKALFMVGDVKQSIYRFRQAEPSIFLERRAGYRPLGEACASVGERVSVALSENYRSRPEVLDTTNYFFGRLFCGGVSEICYTDDDRQRNGLELGYDSRYNSEFAVLRLAPTSKEETEDAVAVEAAYVAERIERLLASGLLVRDGDTARPVRAGDIAVLLRSAGSVAWTYEAALRMRGIEASCGVSAGMTAELAAMLSLLSTIDNPYHDIPLIGALRSPLFGFTADMLAEVRAFRRRDFYRSLVAAAETMPPAAEFLETVSDFRSASLRMPLDRLLLYIYEKTGANAIYSALLAGAGRREALDTLYIHARRYCACPNATLRGFVEYANALIESGKFSETAPPPSDAVRIMTVHKSKGLEFPFVFLGGLAKRFNFRDCYSDILVHPTLGVGMKCYDAQRRIRYPSAMWEEISERMKSETLAEEVRILYVAMTRAREKLFVTTTVKNLDKVADPSQVDDAFIRAAYSQSGWMLPLLRQHPSAQALRGENGAAAVETGACGSFDVVLCDVKPESAVLPLLPSVEGGAASVAAQPPDASAAEVRSERDRLRLRLVDAFSWRYALPTLAAVPSKLTATAIKGLRDMYDEVEEEGDGGLDAAPSERSAPPNQRFVAPLRRPRFVSGTMTPTERGTALHAAMQYCDFAACVDAEAAAAEVQRRLSDPRQVAAAVAEADKIAAFAGSALCARALASDAMYREFRFSILDDAAQYFAEIPKGEEVLLQGVVDLFFIESDAIVVVDFKTDRVTRESQGGRAAEYAPQLDAYARALSRVFGLPARERLVYFLATGDAVAV